MISTRTTQSEDKELFFLVSMTVRDSSKYVIFVSAIDRFAQVKYMQYLFLNDLVPFSATRVTRKRS